MTGIQVQYWANVENERSHRANEALTYLNIMEQYRHNVRSEDINEYNAQTSRFNLLENVRHNQIDEDIKYQTLAENIRSHKENESIAWYAAAENERTHRANESIAWFKAYEDQRAHMEGERISWANLDLQERDVTTRENAQLTREAELIERTQHNLRADAIAAYSNTIRNLEYNLDYAKWYDEGGLKDTEAAKQNEFAARSEYAKMQTTDLSNKQTGSGVYWDTQEWLDYMKLVTGYASLGVSLAK